MNEKRELRRAALLRRDAMTPQELTQKSRLIAQKLCGHPYYQDAAQLLVYASYKSEVQTERIIRGALLENKHVFCPVITGKREMRFFRIDKDAFLGSGFGALLPNRSGIPQPDPAQCAEYVYDPANTLMIMPGCAFDGAGNRIGYGGGFYDTFLEAYPMRTVALFFACQKTKDTIPAEPHDWKPDVIISV